MLAKCQAHKITEKYQVRACENISYYFSDKDSSWKIAYTHLEKQKQLVKPGTKMGSQNKYFHLLLSIKQLKILKPMFRPHLSKGAQKERCTLKILIYTRLVKTTLHD